MPKILKTLAPEMKKAFISYNQGQTSSNTDPARSISTYESVNLKCVAAYLAPESFGSRLPTNSNQKTAVARSRVNYSITVASSGAAGVILFPHNLESSNSFASFPFIQIRNTANFSPASGQSGLDLPTMLGGPFQSSTSTIRATRLNSCSVVFTPTIATLSNQGQVQMVFFQERLNDTFNSASNSGPAIEAYVLPTLRNYIISSLKVTNISMIDILHEESNIKNNFENANYDEGFYLLFTGCSPNATVGTLTVNYNAEYLPSGELVQLVDTQYPENGPATIPFLAALLRCSPDIQSASQSYRIALAEKVINAPCSDFNSLLQYIELDLNSIPKALSHESVVENMNGDFEDI